jgi:hypothetical protein
MSETIVLRNTKGSSLTWTEGDNNIYNATHFTQDGTGAVERTTWDKMRDVVSVKDFGAVGDGITDDTAAFVAALTTGKRVFVPGTSNSYLVDAVLIPNGATLYGEGRKSLLMPFSSLPTSVLTLENGANDIEIYGLTFDINTTTYPLKRGIAGTNNLRTRIHDIHFLAGGGEAIKIDFQEQAIIQRVQIDDVALNGIFLFGCTRSQVLDCMVNLGASSLVGVELNTSFLCQISGCSVLESGIFGYHLDACDRCSITDCYSYNSIREGINVEDSTNCLINSNVVSWPSLTSPSIDFGISIYAGSSSASFNVISNNYVAYPYKSGILVDGSATFNCVNTQIIGNYVYNCNVENDATGAGILVFGANASQTFVSDNYVRDDIGKLKYGVNCVSSALSRIRNNVVIGAATATLVREAAGTAAINSEDMKNWVPSISSGSGTITSSTVNSARYYELEKHVYFSVDITITNNGTGATNVLISLPFTASVNPASVAGREVAVAGFMLSGHISASSANINVAKVDGTYPGGTGNKLVLSGWYERA